MSSRVLKKLQGDTDFDLNNEQDEQLSDNDNPESGSGARKKQLNINRYDLLNQQSPSESEVKEDDNETEHASAASNASVCNISKKKRKKRKKKSAKYSGHQISSEDNEINDKLLNEIGRFLGKANKPTKVSTVPIVQPEADKSLLSVEIKNLNPQYEMRRTFGKRVVKIENKRARGQKLTLKSTYLVSAKESWPPVSKDIISMKICNTSDNVKQQQHKNITWFGYEHSKFYQGIENMFLSAVERMDSDFLVRIIKKCPYHVDALIQLSELCKMTENYSMASELIERAVLILEISLHPTFSLTSGNSRLDYKRQENRAFYVVLFKHAQYLEARACCRTAFEISKLILSFDPDKDPLAIILIIDYYALRSKQYNWLVKFYSEWERTKNLSQLPNMAYSYALALFYSSGDSEESNEALQYALLMFPGVLKPLLEELSVQTDKRVMSHNFFNSGVSSSQSPALHQLVCLYVCRAKVMWRDSNVLPWLERNVNTVLDKVDNGDEIINEYNTKRTQRYVSPPRAILRHVVLSDYKEKVPLAPFIVKEKDPIVMYDPLPPLDSINFYEKKSNNSSPTTSSSRPVSMFFQSMLPSFSLQSVEVNEQQDDNRPENEVERNPENDGGAAAIATGIQSYRELHNSLTSIVDAMRDFLSNIRIAEGEEHIGGDENDSSDEESSD